MRAIFNSIVLIIICGGIGGFAAWALVTTIGVDGTWGAILAAIVGMIISVAAFAGLTTLLRALRWIK